MNDKSPANPPVDFERIRDACIRAALEAYEDAGLRGLCAEGRWDCAVDAMRALDEKALRERPTDKSA